MIWLTDYYVSEVDCYINLVVHSTDDTIKANKIFYNGSRDLTDEYQSTNSGIAVDCCWVGWSHWADRVEQHLNFDRSIDWEVLAVDY